MLVMAEEVASARTGRYVWARNTSRVGRIRGVLDIWLFLCFRPRVELERMPLTVVSTAVFARVQMAGTSEVTLSRIRSTNVTNQFSKEESFDLSSFCVVEGGVERENGI